MLSKITYLLHQDCCYFIRYSLLLMHAYETDTRNTKHCLRQNRKRNHIFASLLSLLIINSIFAQQDHSRTDSIQASILLDKAQLFTDEGKFDSAMQICNVALLS